MIKDYIAITKPGIIRGNLLTACAGFLLASQGTIDVKVLVATLLGIALVIAAACVVNNCLDRAIDRKMARTRQRALASGRIKVSWALIYAGVLLVWGVSLLAAYSNWLTLGLGVLAVLSYIGLYGIAKRRSVHGTLVGTLPGALPPVAGYTAVTNQLDAGAISLLIIMVCWQMAHFYSIAIYRLADYKAAGLPVMPAVRGIKTTKQQIVFYILSFMMTASLLPLYGYTGWAYWLVVLVLGIIWLKLALSGWTVNNDELWAKQMFGWSLVVISGWCAVIALDSFFH